MENERKISFNLENLAAENNCNMQEIVEILEQAIIAGWESMYGEGYNLGIEYRGGQIRLFRYLEVVEKVENPRLQIASSEINKSQTIDMNDKTYIQENLLFNLSRSAIKVVQEELDDRLKTLKRKKIYTFFSGRIGELFTCTIKKICGNVIILMIGEYEGIMDPTMYVQERFQHGQKIPCRLNRVEMNLDYQLYFERKSNAFIHLLLASIVPEISLGAVEVKDIARSNAGCKIAVKSDGSINPISACIGLRQERRNQISKALNAERIEFVLWKDTILQCVYSYFHNIKIERVEIGEEVINIWIPEIDLSKAIGRGGQNAYLTSKLIGKKIMINKFEELKDEDDSLQK